MELVDFLRARLDEDEAAAMRVRSSWRQIGETGVIVASDGGYAEECANGNWTGIAEHIVRHDPARVLAEVEVKRQLLEGAQRWEGGTLEDYILAPLARVWRDHPDFDPVWLEG
ncbi:DUF6221 family protein [Streptomyces sp. NPDC058067]|uniref:DUF6221 family protein n=1 Tax=Streptomyces sp. NPDC058067 TaxID=3346324 RepID=UPI0036E85322